MNFRTGIITMLALGVLLLGGLIAPDQPRAAVEECFSYTDYTHITASIPAEARYLDRMGDLVYVSSLKIVDVALPGEPQIVGNIPGLDGGEVRSIRAVGTDLFVLYSGTGTSGFNGLARYSLSSPTAPVLLATVPLPRFMTQMRIIGDRAYVRNDQGLMVILDISGTDDMPSLGGIGAGWLDSFDLHGNYLYAVDHIRNDVVVVDVTPGVSLAVTYRLPLSDIISISFSDGVGYFLSTTNGTMVLDFSAPDQYTVLNTLPDLTRPLVLRDGLGYSYGLPLQIYGLSDPVNPDLMMTVPFVVHSGLLEAGRGLMLGMSDAFVEMTEGIMGGVPDLAATLEVGATLTAMIAAGDKLVTLSNKGLETFDAADCTSPQLMGSLRWWDLVRGHAMAGDYLYTMVAGPSFGRSILKVFDLRDMNAPVEVVAKNLNGEFIGLVSVGEYLYTSDGHGSLVVIKVTDPLDPGLFSLTPGFGFMPVAAVDGTNMVVMDGTMLRHFDVSSPSAPSPTTSVDTGVEGFAVKLNGNTAYVAYRGGVKVYEVSQLGAKNLLRDLMVPGYVNSMALHDNTLYVEGSGIFMFDVTDPGLVLFAGNLGYVADRVSHLTVLGECLYFDQYVSGDRGRISIAHRHCAGGDTGDDGVVIDIKPGSDINPINCRNEHGVIPVAILTTPDFDALSVDHNTVRFGPGEAAEEHQQGGKGRGKDHDDDELKRHEEDVDGDGDIDLVFHFAKEDAGIACGDTEATLWGETFDGVSFMASDVVRTVPGDDEGDDKSNGHRKTSLAGKASLTLSPNPFNPATTIAFNLPQSQRMRIEIYDLTGRRVAVIADEVFQAGESRLLWQGKDSSGRSVASGVYFVRLSGSGVELKQRALLLK